MFHSNPRSVDRIKQVLINMKEADHLKNYDRLVGKKLDDDVMTWSSNNDD